MDQSEQNRIAIVIVMT